MTRPTDPRHPRWSTAALLARLRAVRSQFSPAAADEKLRCLRELAPRRVAAPRALERLHEDLCYLRAFPDDPRVWRAAVEALAQIPRRVRALPSGRRARLDDSAIAGSISRPGYSCWTSRIMAREYPGEIEIDWREVTATESLEAVLGCLIQPSEQEGFDSDNVSTRAWLRLAMGRGPARGSAKLTDFDWIHAQARVTQAGPTWEALYDAVELPLRWDMGRSRAASTFNALEDVEIAYRADGMRPAPRDPRRLIATPLRAIVRLERRAADRMLAVARAALAARCREVPGHIGGNPDETYLADLGAGVQLAVIGTPVDQRLTLDTNYGFLLLANGMPIGYGGCSPLFRQGNTGVNLFPAFRGSEAAFIFAQALRAFHTLFGCTRFIVNPYQFGEGNSEAIDSGAFWFYYRLGFRPANREVAVLAAREHARRLKSRGYRSDKPTLRRLASGDLHLVLPGARQSDFFDERWLETCALGVTQLLAAEGPVARPRAARRIADRVARRLGVRDRARWPASERRAFERLAPFVALAGELDGWTRADKEHVVAMLRAQGAPLELSYVDAMRSAERLRRDLARYCRRALRQD